jgi:hypothetical protein
MLTVEVRYPRPITNFKKLIDMRDWLDAHQSETSQFGCILNLNEAAIYVGFRNPQDAFAFAITFEGRILDGARIPTSASQ